MRTIFPRDLAVAGTGVVYHNLAVPQLIEHALRKGEGVLTDKGALSVNTGKYTGRSPDDKYIVDTPAVSEKIAWGKINRPIAREKFQSIKAKMLGYLQNKELYVFDGFAGADPTYAHSFRIINEFASQNLFMHQLLIRPSDDALSNFIPDYTVYVAPGFKCIPEVDGVHSEAAIIIDFEGHEALIAGNQYSGEIKKAVFTIMNYELPMAGVLSMHCSANMGKAGDVALFFGLSGTGKTTLSTDSERALVGDDEHGWSDNGIFNIEGGCYAKCIGLDKEKEPEIFDAIRYGAMLENVVLDNRRCPVYADKSLTENTRASYPIDFVPNAVTEGLGEMPQTVFFLTADAFGVLPPIARLDMDAAMYYFISGYTSKLAGTERGIQEPVAVFSTLFGEPFFPLPASVYADMLGEKLDATGARVFMINTGWCGGKAGEVPRIKLAYTRAMISAAIAGKLDHVDYVHDPIFNLDIPVSCPHVPEDMLNPRSLWKDESEYEAKAYELAKKFQKNFESKYPDMPRNIKLAGPTKVKG